MRNPIRVLSTTGLLFCSFLILSPSVNAQEPAPQVEVTPDTHHDVSPPLREIEPTFPSIRFTGRVPTDSAGALEGETSIKAGAGSQNHNLHRWGDYSSIAIDPVDDCTFWYTNEYLKTTGSFNWSTQIASFKFPSCQ